MSLLTAGSNNTGREGNCVRVRLLINRITGLVSSPCVGVFLYASNARYGSVRAFLAFFISIFADLTAASVLPLLWTYVGEQVMCSKFHWRLNCLNSSEVYCCPLSGMHVSRIPYRAKCAFSFLMIVVDLVSSKRL